MMKKIFWVSVFLLSGCAANYSCKAPAGLSCKSLSEVYRIEQSDGMDGKSKPSTHQRKKVSTAIKKATLVKPYQPVKAEAGTPIFTPPKRLRVWIVDWSDQSGRHYIPNHYIYTRLDTGNWVLPAIQMPLPDATAGGNP